ncbi:GPW/gp25 family protein [Bacteroides sp. 51]|uniref:GPW/gp25 family protein n=1 Tax=Bacteroides sp. 51 TaxID=2302938 RepID=UPI0013D30709|nr:GPW/gp25 family protein [Bacteroides sp. 51]NDV82958.1 hypothetical protein [Bacteroides sp. 51]
MDKDKTFLGQGWAFPPEFNGGITPTEMVSAEEDIRQSLYILLSTRTGERIMRPEFGCNIYELVFHNMDLTARTQLIETIRKAVLYFEPRITLDDVLLDTSEEPNGILQITLEYTIRMTNTRSNMVYPYYYEEHF